MKKFALNILFLSLFSSSFLIIATDAVAAPEKPLQLCYFSLSSTKINPKERFQTSAAVEVKEFYGEDSAKPPSKRFEEMVKDGENKCDALVISGHHTGAFYGDNVSHGGALSLKTIEKLSCDHPEFFKKIKALWLHGCNTTVDGSIEGKKRTADSATQSYIKTYGASAGTANFISYTYSDVFDEYTPFTSRYLRSFPNTQIYGFSGKAATEENHLKNASPNPTPKQVHDDIYRHLQQFGKKLKEKEIGKNSTETPEQLIKRAAMALASGEHCDEAREAWEGIYDHNQELAIKNKDLAKAKKLGCDLIKAKQAYQEELRTGKEVNVEIKEGVHVPAKEALVVALKAIKTEATQDKDLIHLLFNNISETFKLAKGSDDVAFSGKVKTILAGDEFINPLKEKIGSDKISSLKKIDYLKFYEHLKGRDGVVNNGIAAQLKQVNTATGNQLFSVLVAEQLRQYDYLKKDDIKAILENTDLFPENNKDKSIEAIKYNMLYSSYTKGGGTSEKQTQTQELNDLYAEMKKEQDSYTWITKEALRNEDLKTIGDLFSAIRSENDGKLTKKVVDFRNLAQGKIMDHFKTYPNKNKFFELMKKSEGDQDLERIMDNAQHDLNLTKL